LDDVGACTQRRATRRAAFSFCASSGGRGGLGAPTKSTCAVARQQGGHRAIDSGSSRAWRELAAACNATVCRGLRDDAFCICAACVSYSASRLRHGWCERDSTPRAVRRPLPGGYQGRRAGDGRVFADACSEHVSRVRCKARRCRVPVRIRGDLEWRISTSIGPPSRPAREQRCRPSRPRLAGEQLGQAVPTAARRRGQAP
jgi:hypothetical protein